MSRLVVGTRQRTWLERDKNRVGRFFHPAQLPLINRLHDLSRELARHGVPVQLPISEPAIVDDRIIIYYTLCEDDPRDYEGNWYVPRESVARRRHAATVFAAFQRVGMELEGPSQPLDYPYCNTMEWLFAAQGIHALVGRPLDKLLHTALGNPLVELERIVDTFVVQARPVVQQSPWGLCHGDYHSGNVIFVDSEVGAVIDFGFWIHHPLVFDLAVALELWGRNYDTEQFALHPQRVAEFLRAYAEAAGPVEPSPAFFAVLPLARLWLEMYRFRSLVVDADFGAAQRLLMERILPRLQWYAEYGAGFLETTLKTG